MDLKLKGNAALVTASSSGLGRAVARSLARENVNVAVNGRSQEKLDETVRELKELGSGKVIGIQGDITKKADIENLVEKTYQEFGQLDHLVTSAGGPPSTTFMETTDEDWYQSYDLLVMSVVRIVRAASKYLKAGSGGTIVNITSMSTKEAIEGLVLSNSVRMAVIGLMKTLSKEFGPKIRANAVLPGPHETSRMQDLINAGIKQDRFESYQEGLEAWSDGIPVDKIGEPDRLGDLVAFLSSPLSNYINGTAIPIDGGKSSSNL
ncbi:MAG: SDR family oxidoreductase [Halarsenatibacteraceae bacterium]